MNTFLASLIGGFCGLLQLVVIAVIESRNEHEQSGLLASDVAFAIFAVLVMAEIICVIALAMYRICPWLLRKTGDAWEADRVDEGRRRSEVWLQNTTVAATVLRRIVVTVDSGSFSSNLLLTLGVALAPLLIPKPRV